MRGDFIRMTYEELCDFEVLYAAYLVARKGKRKSAGLRNLKPTFSTTCKAS